VLQRTKLALTLAVALTTPAWAQTPVSDRDGGDVSPLEALDEVTSEVVAKVAPSIVLLEVEHSSYGPRRLTRAERAGLGVTGRYDERYFSRPEGPVSAVVVGVDVVATATFNVAGDGAITVITPDGRRLTGQRLGRDENMDLALVKVEGSLGIQPLPASKRDLVPGRFLYLVGRTEANAPIVTSGIVSGLERYRGDAFAHSCRTSYSNIGGALVDMDGGLVGFSVRHSNRVRQGQNSGVGFGATLAQLEDSRERLVAGEVIPRRKTPFLGIQADIAATGGPGVRIQQVIPDTAAAKAGLKAGDWIKIFNQVDIESFTQLREEIQALAIGTEIMITIVRDGEEQDIRVALGGRLEDE
jgi:S1-C subfamily serine protease